MIYDLNKYPSNGPTRAPTRIPSRGRRYRKKRRHRIRRFILTTSIFYLLISAIFYVFSTIDPRHINNILVDTLPSNSVIIQNNQALDGNTSESIPDQSEETENKNEYDFSSPVPLSEAVDTNYFDDSVFIGDSRTEGFILYTGLINATSFVHKGLMVDTVFTSPLVNIGGKKLSVIEALKKTSFSKVYIMFGINEIGWVNSNLFIQKYGEIIDEIKNINPEAIIYVQSVLPVSQKVSSSHSYVKNPRINEYNLLIQQMAEEKEIYYINSAESVATSEGLLPEEAALDGIHLKKDYCEKWLEYLKTHTVNSQ